MTSPPAPVALVILAGGRGRRLGGVDKPLIAMPDDRPLLAHALQRLAPWPGPLLISAGGDASRFAAFRAPVLADFVTEADGGGAGPLAGLLAAMRWLETERPDIAWLVSLPGDLPTPPRDLLTRLRSARAQAHARAAVAMSGGRVHNVVGLWPVAAAAELEGVLTVAGLRRVGAWVDSLNAARADWGTAAPDPFDNINTPQDLDRAREALAKAPPDL